MEFKHYIVTRFNCHSPKELDKKSNLDFATESWMDHRFKLFSNFTIPSVRNQKGEFSWIIRFHPSTNKKWIDMCEDLCKGLPIIIFTGINDNWVDVVKNKSDFVITSRLDSDDLLGPNYVNATQNAFKGKRELILWEKGLVISKDAEFSFTQLSNPFLSLIEDKDNIKGCYHSKHLDMINIEQYSVLEGSEWCQVIHRINISNRIRKGCCKIENSWARGYQEKLKKLNI